MIQLERGTFAKIAVTGGPGSACSSLFFSTRRRRAQERVGRLYWVAEFAMFCIGQHCCPNLVTQPRAASVQEGEDAGSAVGGEGAPGGKTSNQSGRFQRHKGCLQKE
jgi:hypothetical protein